MTKLRTSRTRRLLEAVAVITGICVGAGLWYEHSAQPASESSSLGNPAVAVKPNAAGGIQKPAALVADPAHAPLFAAIQVGKRIVAVGEHGVILLSDDEGRTFRQAKNVPTQALLTSLSFIDEQHGWAAGHDGVVIHTGDGGETWTLQREDLDGDKPLFSIFFKDAQHGFAVGLFGTAVQTADGGSSWTPLNVETGEGTGSESRDHHLYSIFGDPATALCIAGEAGLIYRSADGGATWTTVKTSNPGSFWTGARLQNGSLLAAGQRGHVFLSRDHGTSWTEVPSGTQQSLTGVVQNTDGSLLIAGLAGTTLSSSDGGNTLVPHTRGDRVPINAALALPGSAVLLFGDKGLASGN